HGRLASRRFPCLGAIDFSRGLHISVSGITLSEGCLASSDTAATSARLTSKRQSLDTGGGALTGAQQPAAREHPHLVWSESGACAPSFSLASAGYRRFMKGGRNDHFEVSPRSSVFRIPP